MRCGCLLDRYFTQTDSEKGEQAQYSKEQINSDFALRECARDNHGRRSPTADFSYRAAILDIAAAPISRQGIYPKSQSEREQAERDVGNLTTPRLGRKSVSRVEPSTQSQNEGWHGKQESSDPENGIQTEQESHLWFLVCYIPRQNESASRVLWRRFMCLNCGVGRILVSRRRRLRRLSLRTWSRRRFRCHSHGHCRCRSATG
jgi:hypothetical protein